MHHNRKTAQPLWEPHLWTEQVYIRNFGRGWLDDHFCQSTVKSVHQFQRRRYLRFSLLVAMSTRILHGSTSSGQFWWRTTRGIFTWSVIIFGLTVSEEMSFKAIFDDARFTTHGQRPVTIAHMSTSCSGELTTTTTNKQTNKQNNNNNNNNKIIKINSTHTHMKWYSFTLEKSRNEDTLRLLNHVKSSVPSLFEVFRYGVVCYFRNAMKNGEVKRNAGKIWWC